MASPSPQHLLFQRLVLFPRKSGVPLLSTVLLLSLLFSVSRMPAGGPPVSLAPVSCWLPPSTPGPGTPEKSFSLTHQPVLASYFPAAPQLFLAHEKLWTQGPGSSCPELRSNLRRPFCLQALPSFPCKGIFEVPGNGMWLILGGPYSTDHSVSL